MRLVRLKIKNIASLRGEHVVDFSAIQRQSSLFAITGETGSGKSSILNSIGLALYGQIYKKNVTQVDVVTLGEKEGEIQLIFQVAGQNYLADWKAKVRKQNGELLQKPIMQRQIFPIDGEDFNSLRGEPIESVERLLNLDFDQFCKCIILNQGEFARFLSSSFTERKEILEKLYPGELLDNLSRELKTQVDTFEREKDDLDIKLGELKGDSLNGEGLFTEQERLKKDLELHSGWLTKVEGLEFHFISLSNYHNKYHENKKKSDLIKSDIALATTAYNQVLKESQVINESYQQSKLRQDKELPRLQDLLKTEEGLKHSHEAEQSILKKSTDSKQKIVLLEKVLTENEQKLKLWENEHQKLSQAFKFKVEDLKFNRERLQLIFDLFTETQTLKLEQNSLTEKLQELEAQGKEVNLEFAQVNEKIKEMPLNLKEGLSAIETKKSELSKSVEQRQKAELKTENIKKQLDQHLKEMQLLELKQKTSVASLVTFTHEQLALETSLKLQELTQAIEVCLTHASTVKSETCPVCTNSVPPLLWGNLLSSLNKADIGQMKLRSMDVARHIISLEEENKLSQTQNHFLQGEIKLKTEEHLALMSTIKVPLPSMQELDEEIKVLQKKAWNLDNLKLEEVRLQTELNRARENFLKARTKGLELSQNLLLKEKALETSTLESAGLIPYPLTPSFIETLKADYRLLSQFLHSEVQGDKLLQEQSFSRKNHHGLTQDLTDLNLELTQLSGKISAFRSLLKTELGDKSAHELIETLNREVKILSENWTKSERDLKQHELTLKEFQSRLYTLDEQLKEYDMLFVKELHEIRELSTVALPDIKEELTLLLAKLKNLSLDFSSSPELFAPIKETLTRQKELLKDDCNNLRMTFASVNQRLTDWEKRQDKIRIFEMTRADLTLKLNRLQRLFEVLGKDELRSFVLSLVEENLIIQTNEELLKLCQGRYEIIHQSRGMRMTPEFYILDKFRGGDRRKVSTLSGGETFMVSLAMALALAEMTRGQAEIDSLFIDEGFGTLDEDSLEDVLDMLNQIQTRGLMVGLISHIKTLTNSIPVNLMLAKRQDGTSSISMQVN